MQRTKIKTKLKSLSGAWATRHRITSDRVGLKATSIPSSRSLSTANKSKGWAFKIWLMKAAYLICLDFLVTTILWRCQSKAHLQCRTSQLETPFTLRSQMICKTKVKIIHQTVYVEAVELKAPSKPNLERIWILRQASYRQRSWYQEHKKISRTTRKLQKVY